jgi:probable F420-dependent oxidoreductase
LVVKGSGKVGVTMPILNQKMDEFPRMAAAADAAGLDTLFDYEFYRNPFVIHATTALVTDRIQLATGLAIAASRSPFEMANAAADLDELSNGRTILGMGIGSADWAEVFHGVDTTHPASRLREYIHVLKLAWEYLATAKPLTYEGKYYKFLNPQFNPFGTRDLVRPHIPIYLAALRPAMLRLAGEAADGVIGYLMNPRYVKEVTLPAVAEGARRAGRDPSSIDIASETICSVHPDRAEAFRRARIHVGTYVAYPPGLPVIEHLGFEKQRLAVLDAYMREGVDGFQAAVGDDLIEAFSITGTPDECRKQLREYHEVMPHVVMHTPYVPGLTSEESRDSYYHIVKAFAK